METDSGGLRGIRSSRSARRFGSAVAILLIGAVAAFGGLLAGGTEADIGPFDTTLAVKPDLHGETVVDIPPLGDVVFDSHDGPLGLNMRLDSVDPQEAQVIINTPTGSPRPPSTWPPRSPTRSSVRSSRRSRS
ncbi:hypothetical protein GCM10029992_39020 [Glycomyces albus]